MNGTLFSPMQIWSFLLRTEVQSSASRLYHLTHHEMATNRHKKTRIDKLAELNKKIGVHRNFPFGPHPVFYRGPKKIDLRQRHLDKMEAHRQWLTYSRQIQVGESPVDDVYLTNLYKEREYNLSEAVSVLRKYTQLDLTDQQSPIILSLSLDEIMRKTQGRKKRPLLFFKTLRLPHPHQLKNKICLFTEDEKLTDDATDMGVNAVGMSDVINQIVSGSLSCDAYFATANSLNQLLTNADLKRRLGLQIPTKKFNLIERAEQMRDAIDDVIVHNMADHKHCNVIVGVPRQDCEQIEANIRQVFDAVQFEATQCRADKIINAASLSCFTEPLMINLSDVIDDL